MKDISGRPLLLKMLQILPDSDIPKSWLSFDKSFFSPDFPADCFFAQDSGRPFETKPYAQFETAGYPSAVPKSNDQFRGRSWMKPHEYQARNPLLSSRKPMVQKQLWRENSGCWRGPFAPFDTQPQSVQSYQPQHQPMPQGQCLPAERARTLSLPDINGQYLESDTKCLGGSQTFKDVKPNGPSPDMYHPVPKPSHCLAANTFASFMDVDEVGQTPPIFDFPDESKQQRPSLDLGDTSFHQPPGLMNDNTGGISPFHMKGSPDTDSVSTERHYTPTQAPIPWPTHKLPSQWNIQQQENWPDLNWTNIPLFQPGGQNPGFPNPEFDNSIPIDESFSLGALPQLNHNFQNAQSLFFPNPCKPGPNPSYDFCNIPDINTDTETTYHNNTMYFERQPSIGTDAISQERRDYRTIAFHGENANAFLIDCKRRGLSYKEIKRAGNFKEAESTLRGRFRTLTKSKEQRVRKPQWQPRDVSCLSVCGTRLIC